MGFSKRRSGHLPRQDTPYTRPWGLCADIPVGEGPAEVDTRIGLSKCHSG
jgi:hypothetical protein